MARARTIVGIVALLSVLLNAAALVRHHWNMLDAQARYAELAADMVLTCRGHVSDTALVADTQVPLPGSPTRSGDCPVCMGLSANVAILIESHLPFEIVVDDTERLAVMASAIARRMAGEWPPPRGPPVIA